MPSPLHDGLGRQRRCGHRQGHARERRHPQAVGGDATFPQAAADVLARHQDDRGFLPRDVEPTPVQPQPGGRERVGFVLEGQIVDRHHQRLPVADRRDRRGVRGVHHPAPVERVRQLRPSRDRPAEVGRPGRRAGDHDRYGGRGDPGGFVLPSRAERREHHLVGSLELGPELPDVGADAAGRREPQLVDVERHRERRITGAPAHPRTFTDTPRCRSSRRDPPWRRAR